ncbi:MAG: U32 family peptidase [Bacteroidales bacterium]|nr:U32 family peptidase [Bacteroidales bacterium]
MKITPIELLSPAKDVEVGLAAINHGADAVYIGGPAFGAREKAGNSLADIERLCRHAALFDAKVYVTLNTLLYDSELETARQIALDCWDAGVDALIVQDMALLQMDLPIPLHASTQCDNLTVEKVKFLEQVGFSQVVLGRELSVEQIREIRRQTTVPLEFFVHGALCVSHSGQCYLSHYIGNRSANRGACAQPCRLPWDLLDETGRVLIKGKHLLCLKDLNNSAHLEELMEAGITSFKIEGRLKDADYVKNVTAYYRRLLDGIFDRRPEFAQASLGHGRVDFEVNPEKSFNRGFTDYFIHGRQEGIGSPDTPKSMGEYIGEVKWCNSVQMEIATDKLLHNGDGLCFLNGDGELVGIRADVVRNGTDTVRNGTGAVRNSTVSTNRPHGARRGYWIYRNYDIEWQKQVDASQGHRKIDIDLVLSETETGYELSGKLNGKALNEAKGVKVENGKLSTFHFPLSTPQIVATNPEKATENIRRKLMQWGDTVFNPVNLELRLSEPRLIPASVLGEMKRGLVERMTEALIEQHRQSRSCGTGVESTDATPPSDAMAPSAPYPMSVLSYLGNVTNHLAEAFYRQHGVEEIEPALEKTFSKASGLTLMTTHHCIRYANGMCLKEHPSYTGPLYLRHGENTFRLEFDCKQCLMKLISV